MDLSDLTKNCHVFTAEQSSVDFMPPNQPAVYAFYDLFRFSDSKMPEEIDRFKTKHARFIALKKEKMPHLLGIQLRGNPERFKGEGKRIHGQTDPKRLPAICRNLMFLSFLNEPLYVGKTSDVKTRFVAHHDKDFLFFMKNEYQRSPDEFLFFAYYCQEDETRLLESILIQLINPPFCDQKT